MQQLFLEEKKTDSVEYVTVRRPLSIGDIIMVQTIFCVLVILAFAVINIFDRAVLSEILSFLKARLDAPFELSGDIEGLFSKLRELI